MRDFRKLHIWHDAVALSIEIYQLADSFPKRETYGLVSQITRAAVSVPSNIAEGCRGSDKELRHYLNIALGSSFELETQVIIAYRIGYIPEQKYSELLPKITILQKRINAFRNTLK